MSSTWWDKIGADARTDEVALEKSEMRINRAIFAIALGGFFAGACDLTYALAFYGVQGVPPIRLLQSIASGLLGTNSYLGGWPSAVLGLALHFLIALSAAAIYYLASRRITILLSRAPLFGALYGAALYFFMRKVVLPLSAAPHFQSTALAASTDLMVHVFLIGLPIALIVRHYSSQPAKHPADARP